MFGLSGYPTLPDGQWLLTMLLLIGFMALGLHSRRGTRAQRAERLTRQRGQAAKLALGALAVFVLWFGVVFVVGAGQVVQALLAD